jgi:alpha-L-fucosidase
MNPEQILVEEYKRLADRFTAEHFDAEALADLAVRAGMRYVVLTTMHHEGYRLYPTALSGFCSQRDLVG